MNVDLFLVGALNQLKDGMLNQIFKAVQIFKDDVNIPGKVWVFFCTCEVMPVS